jgi:hypothetical protein
LFPSAKIIEINPDHGASNPKPDEDNDDDRSDDGERTLLLPSRRQIIARVAV